MTTLVLFARTLLYRPYTHTTLYLWGRPVRSGRSVTYCKLLCYRTIKGKEYTYSIIPQGEGYEWRVKHLTGVSPTFATAWSHMPAFLKYPAKYRDSQRVKVSHTGITTLHRLWRAERIAPSKGVGGDVPLGVE